MAQAYTNISIDSNFLPKIAYIEEHGGMDFSQTVTASINFLYYSVSCLMQYELDTFVKGKDLIKKLSLKDIAKKARSETKYELVHSLSVAVEPNTESQIKYMKDFFNINDTTQLLSIAIEFTHQIAIAASETSSRTYLNFSSAEKPNYYSKLNHSFDKGLAGNFRRARYASKIDSENTFTSKIFSNQKPKEKIPTPNKAR